MSEMKRVMVVSEAVFAFPTRTEGSRLILEAGRKHL